MKGQLDLFNMIEVSERELRIDSRKAYSNTLIIPSSIPLRNEALQWALDYDWHEAEHICEELIAERVRNRKEHPDGRVKPVVYFNPWIKKTGRWQLSLIGHSEISTCPYCGVDLNAGEGDIQIERRFKGRPYYAVYERPWDTVTKEAGNHDR